MHAFHAARDCLIKVLDLIRSLLCSDVSATVHLVSPPQEAIHPLIPAEIVKEAKGIVVVSGGRGKRCSDYIHASHSYLCCCGFITFACQYSEIHTCTNNQ